MGIVFVCQLVILDIGYIGIITEDNFFALIDGYKNRLAYKEELSIYSVPKLGQIRKLMEAVSTFFVIFRENTYFLSYKMLDVQNSPFPVPC